MRDQEFQQKINEALAQSKPAAGMAAIKAALRDYRDCLTREANIRFCVEIINAPNSSNTPDALQWFLLKLFNSASDSVLLQTYICFCLQTTDSVSLRDATLKLPLALRLKLLARANVENSDPSKSLEKAFAFLWESFTEVDRTLLLRNNEVLRKSSCLTKYLADKICTSIQSDNFASLHQFYSEYSQFVDMQSIIIGVLNKGDEELHERFIRMIDHQLQNNSEDDSLLKTLRSLIIVAMRTDLIDMPCIERDIPTLSTASSCFSLASVLAECELGQGLMQGIIDCYQRELREKSVDKIAALFANNKLLSDYYLTHEATFTVVVEKQDWSLMASLLWQISSIDQGACLNHYLQRKAPHSNKTYLETIIALNASDFNYKVFFALIGTNKLTPDNVRRLIDLVGEDRFIQALLTRLSAPAQANDIVLIGNIIPHLSPTNPQLQDLIEHGFRQSRRDERPHFLSRVIAVYAKLSSLDDQTLAIIICDRWLELSNEECRPISLQDTSLAHETKLLETAISKEHQHCFTQVWQRMSSQHKHELMQSDSPINQSLYLSAAIDTHIQNAFYYPNLAEVAACFELYGVEMIRRMDQLVINRPRQFISGEGPALCARDLITLTCYCLDNPDQILLAAAGVKALVNFALNHDLLHERVDVAGQEPCRLLDSLIRRGDEGHRLLQDYDHEYARLLQGMTDEELERFIQSEPAKYRVLHPALWEAVITRNNTPLLSLLLTKIARASTLTNASLEDSVEKYLTMGRRVGDETEATTPLQRLLAKGQSTMVMALFKLHKPIFDNFLGIMNGSGCDQFAVHLQVFAETNPCVDLLLMCKHRYIHTVFASILPKAFQELALDHRNNARLALFAAKLAQNNTINVPTNRKQILAQIGQALVGAPNAFTADWVLAKEEMRRAFVNVNDPDLLPFARICQHPDTIRRSLAHNPVQPGLAQGLCFDAFLSYFMEKYEKEVQPKGADGLVSNEGKRYMARLTHFIELCQHIAATVQHDNEVDFKRLLAEKLNGMERPAGRTLLFFISATKERYLTLVEALKPIPVATLRYRFYEMLANLTALNGQQEAAHPIRYLAPRLQSLMPQSAQAALQEEPSSTGASSSSVGSTSSLLPSPFREWEF